MDISFSLGADGFTNTNVTHRLTVHRLSKEEEQATPLPDGGTVELPIEITNPGAVLHPVVGFRADHPQARDLVLDLVHPDGTAVRLHESDRFGINFGLDSKDCDGRLTRFDDKATKSIDNGSPPYVNEPFRPKSPLSALDGKPLPGTYKLRVFDKDANGVTGTAYCVVLGFDTRRRRPSRSRSRP